MFLVVYSPLFILVSIYLSGDFGWWYAVTFILSYYFHPKKHLVHDEYPPAETFLDYSSVVKRGFLSLLSDPWPYFTEVSVVSSGDQLSPTFPPFSTSLLFYWAGCLRNLSINKPSSQNLSSSIQYGYPANTSFKPNLSHSYISVSRLVVARTFTKNCGHCCYELMSMNWCVTQCARFRPPMGNCIPVQALAEIIFFILVIYDC